MVSVALNFELLIKVLVKIIAIKEFFLAILRCMLNNLAIFSYRTPILSTIEVNAGSKPSDIVLLIVISITMLSIFKR